MRPLPRLLPAFLLFAASAAASAAPARRVVVQASPDFARPAVEELAAGARARGVEVRIEKEGGPVEPGFDLLRVSTLPPSEMVRSAVLVFPIQLDAVGFVFDGRPYRRVDEAIRLTTSTRGEIIVLGNSKAAALALAGRWLASPGSTDYEVLSGEVSRDGKFQRREGRLFVDPATDRDRHRAARRVPRRAQTPHARLGRLGVSRKRRGGRGEVGEDGRALLGRRGRAS